MMLIIPIAPVTIDLITKLNDGVQPAFEDEPTFYVYRGEGESSEIISNEAMREWTDEYMTLMRIQHKN